MGGPNQKNVKPHVKHNTPEVIFFLLGNFGLIRDVRKVQVPQKSPHSSNFALIYIQKHEYIVNFNYTTCSACVLGLKRPACGVHKSNMKHTAEKKVWTTKVPHQAPPHAVGLVPCSIHKPRSS